MRCPETVSAPITGARIVWAAACATLATGGCRSRRTESLELPTRPWKSLSGNRRYLMTTDAPGTIIGTDARPRHRCRRFHRQPSLPGAHRSRARARRFGRGLRRGRAPREHRAYVREPRRSAPRQRRRHDRSGESGARGGRAAFRLPQFAQGGAAR